MIQFYGAISIDFATITSLTDNVTTDKFHFGVQLIFLHGTGFTALKIFG